MGASLSWDSCTQSNQPCVRVAVTPRSNMRDSFKRYGEKWKRNRTPKLFDQVQLNTTMCESFLTWPFWQQRVQFADWWLTIAIATVQALPQIGAIAREGERVFLIFCNRVGALAGGSASGRGNGCCWSCCHVCCIRVSACSCLFVVASGWTWRWAKAGWTWYDPAQPVCSAKYIGLLQPWPSNAQRSRKLYKKSIALKTNNDHVRTGRRRRGGRHRGGIFFTNNLSATVATGHLVHWGVILEKVVIQLSLTY